MWVCVGVGVYMCGGDLVAVVVGVGVCRCRCWCWYVIVNLIYSIKF